MRVYLKAGLGYNQINSGITLLGQKLASTKSLGEGEKEEEKQLEIEE